MSRKIFFVTGNANKVDEMQSILDLSNAGIKIEQIIEDIDEISSDDVEKIVLNKARQTYAKYRMPLFCEDTGVFIESLNGFPAANARFVFEKIGLKGILKLMDGESNRDAYMLTAICYMDNEKESHVFSGKMDCIIADSIRGTFGFGYDSILIPKSLDKTFGEDESKKHMISARAKAFRKFMEYLNNQQNPINQ